jgi:hypothetical protein
MMFNVILPNAILFQLVWWSAILQYEVLSVVFLSCMAIHFLYTSKTIGKELLLIVIVGLGIATDALLYRFGLFQFQDQDVTFLLPGWLMILWAAFTMSMTRSLTSMSRHLYTWIVLCVVFAPLSYYVGSQYGRIQVEPLAIVAMVVQWTLIAAISHWLIRRFQMGAKYET